MRKILIIAFVLRFSWFLIVALGEGQAWTQDSQGYAALAESLYDKGEFSQGGHPETFRTPGYPVFVVLGKVLGDLTWGTLILQVFLSTATVYLLYLLVLRVCGDEKKARWAALLYAFEPLSIIYSSYLLTETLFVFLIMCFLERVYIFFRKKNFKILLIASLALAAALFVRPIAFYLPPILLVMFLLALWKPQCFFVDKESKWSKKQVIVSLTIFIFCTICLPYLWMLRNEKVANVRAFNTLNQSYFTFQAAATLSQVNKQSVFEARQNLEKQYETNPKVATDVLKENPFVFAKIYIKGWTKTLLDPGSVDGAKQLGRYPPVGGLANKMIEEGITSVLLFLMKERPLLFFMSLVLGAGLLGYYFLAFRGLRREYKLLLPLLLIFMYFFLLSGGSNALARYRFPLMPFLAIFAGVGCGICRKVEE